MADMVSRSEALRNAMSRTEACGTLTVAQCDKAMEGIVCERWSNRSRRYADKGMYDLSEPPGAYKNIDEVIANEADLVKPVVTLSPLASLKG